MTQASRENSELKFIINDIYTGYKVLNYFQSKILKAHTTGFDTVQVQLIQVHIGLEVTLRRDVFESLPETMIDNYWELLIEKDEIWAEIYRPQQQPYSYTPPNPSHIP